ncbi:MAG: STAS domain-containing protein [Methanoregulaceae archaeon]
MEIQSIIKNGVFVVTLGGRMDETGIVEFQEARGAWARAPVILDLTGLDYISSSGLRAILRMKQEHGGNGNVIVVTGSYGLTRRIIRLSGFEHVFTGFSPIHKTLQTPLCAAPLATK